jgi:hypothetical protein
MPDVRYNLLDDDGFLYATQYLLTKLKPYIDNVNITYTISLDTTNKWIVLTGNDGSSSHVSYADFGDKNVIETVKVNGTALTPDANKAVNVSVPTKTSDITNDSNFVSDANYVHTDNNYTTAEKNKLSRIAAGAQVNKIETVKVNGTALSIDASKAVNIPAAGATTKGVISNTDVNTLIQAALAGFERISFQKVNSYGDLPATGQNGVIYLVPISGAQVPNIYDEYIWYTDSSTTPSTSGYEKIGTTAIDLSGYVQHTDIHLLTNQEITDIVDDAYDAVFNPTP